MDFIIIQVRTHGFTPVVSVAQKLQKKSKIFKVQMADYVSSMSKLKKQAPTWRPSSQSYHCLCKHSCNKNIF